MLGGLTLKIEEAEPTCSNLPVFLGNIAVTLLLVEIKLKGRTFLLLILMFYVIQNMPVKPCKIWFRVRIRIKDGTYQASDSYQIFSGPPSILKNSFFFLKTCLSRILK